MGQLLAHDTPLFSSSWKYLNWYKSHFGKQVGTNIAHLTLNDTHKSEGAAQAAPRRFKQTWFEVKLR